MTTHRLLLGFVLLLPLSVGSQAAVGSHIVSKTYTPWIQLASEKSEEARHSLWKDRVPLQFPTTDHLADLWPYSLQMAQAAHDENATLGILMAMAFHSH